MMDFITAPLIVGIVTLGTYKLFELFVCKRERLSIIEKLGDKLTLPVELNKLSLPNYSFSRSFSFGALKAGCLLMGIGLGLFVGLSFCTLNIPNYFLSSNNWEVREMSGVVYGSFVLFFGGAGLITAFIIETKKKKEGKKKQGEE
ncbi:hypothetical protein EZS27_012407 [termite gut metagenome]|jgi:hypothetical protein|uniref:DUF6249 domain-containing protein n=1 Tax=termite gut metagenome TaxID=433724 RepID=A0A5J4S2E8_9ZZZZ